MPDFKTITPGEVSTQEIHAAMLGGIGPRPIALASTIDLDGKKNLAPFSFFNAFGSNPPILVFSPAIRIRNTTSKDTLNNVKLVPEVVINAVNYEMVEQVSLASCEYPENIDEFVKSGLTPLASDIVKPFRVEESPVSFECKVNSIIETGLEGGAGNLVICQILKVHIKHDVLNDSGRIDTNKIDLVGRLGGDWYSRTNLTSIFEVPKPNVRLGIGFDQLPEYFLKAPFFTKNNLARLANIEKIPGDEEAVEFRNSALMQEFNKNSPKNLTKRHQLAIDLGLKLLSDNRLAEAWLLFDSLLKEK